MSDLQRRLSRLQQVLAAAERIHSTLELDTILATFLELSVRELDCEGGTIYSLDRERGELESRHVISPIAVEGFRLEAGQGIAGQVAASGEPAIVEDTGRDEAFTREIDRQTGFHTVNTIAFPLADQEGEVIGVLQLVNKRVGGFSEDDVGFLGELAVFVSLAIGNALLFRDKLEKARFEEELGLARQIQELILPDEHLGLPGYDAASVFVPCHETAGDYYHVFPGREGSVVVLMDVSGKGVAAAMVSFAIHAFLSAEIGRRRNLGEVASELNAFLFRNFGGRKYATGLLLRARRDGSLEYVNGGHPPVLARGPGGASRLASTGLPFGLLEMASFRSATHELGVGDVVALYSDGYNETVDERDEEFGIARLAASLEEVYELSPEAICDRLHGSLLRFQGRAPTPDDRTLLVLRKI